MTSHFEALLRATTLYSTTPRTNADDSDSRFGLLPSTICHNHYISGDQSVVNWRAYFDLEWNGKVSKRLAKNEKQVQAAVNQHTILFD